MYCGIIWLQVALIAGVTGIVGNSLAAKLLQEPKAPESSSWKVYGVARRSAKPDWLPESLHYIGCNLLDREETLSKLSRLQDVTHLFYVTWVNRHHDQHSALPQHSRRIAAECQKLSAHRVADWDEALSRPV